MNKVIKIIRQTVACPAQWELTLDTGEYVYVRYRNGWFRSGMGKSEKEYWKKKTEWYNARGQ